MNDPKAETGSYPGLTEMIDELLPDPPSIGEPIWIDSMNLDLPLEFYVRTNPAGLAIEASLPTQDFPTSILPVFHRIRLRVKAEVNE